MKDEKTKMKEEKLIEMVSAFCDEKLDENYKQLSIKLIQKLGRKHNVPFKRGKLENWASGIIYALGQINFLFDKSFEPYATPDDICNYFKTKKSTASNKARDIRKLLNLTHFDREFSTQHLQKSTPKVYMDEKTGLLIPAEYMLKQNRNVKLEELMDKVYEYGNNEIPDDLNDEFIDELISSVLLCQPIFELGGVTFIQTHCNVLFFPFFTNYDEYRKTFPNESEPIPFSFYDFCEIIHGYENPDFEGVKLNPDNQDLYVSCELMSYLYEIYEKVD